MKRSVMVAVGPTGPVLALLACAGAADRGPLEITPLETPRGQACTLSGGDFPLAAIVDSSAAVSAAERAGAPDGALLLSVGTDSTGAPSRFRRIETTLPEAAAGALESALEPLVRSPDGESRSGRLLVETAGGRVTRLAVGPGQVCRPALADPRETQRALEDVYRQHRKTGTAHVWLYVDTTGVVEKGHVQRGTGDPILDAAILGAGKRALFHPALIDRRPVAVYVALDLTVQVACPPSDTVQWRRPPDDPCRNAGRGRSGGDLPG